MADIDIADDDEAKIMQRLAAHGIHPREVTEDIRQLMEAVPASPEAVTTQAPATTQSPASDPAQPGGSSAPEPTGAASLSHAQVAA